MPTPEWVKAASREKRKRVCTICGAEFMVKKTSHEGRTCSLPCRKQLMSASAKKRRASDETRAKMRASAKAKYGDLDYAARHRAATAKALKRWHSEPANAEAFAKRSSDRMKRRHADPEWQKVRDARSSRVMKENWKKYRDEFSADAAARYAAHLAAGTGINSAEAMARKAEASKWIMKKASDALHAETDYNEVYAEVQARLRREFPYDGPKEGSDYYEYCSKLGTMVVNSPECREIADSFMSDAIPRFAREWNAMKTEAESPF